MSAPRDDQIYIRHILDSIARIDSYLHGVTEKHFLNTPLIQDAVIRQILVIGEAAKRVSGDLRHQTPGIPWADIAGMRDKLVHDYLGINLGAVWDTANRDLATLKAALHDTSEGSNGS